GRRREQAACQVERNRGRIRTVAMLPLAGTRCGIDRTQRGELLLALDQSASAARDSDAEVDWRRRLARLPDGAGFVRGHEEQAPHWIKRRRLEVRSAVIVR